MERYLKDEPKLPTLQKLPTDLETAWDLFAAPSVVMSSWNMGMEDSSEHTFPANSGSPGHSGMSWEGTVNCSVVVKKEPLDDYEDDELCCYEMDLLQPSKKETNRTKRGRNDSKAEQTCQSGLVQVKTEPRSSRLAAKKNKKQHNQARNMSSGSHSDSSSSSSSSRSHQTKSKLGETTALVQPKTESTMDLLVRSNRNSTSSCSDSSDHLPILTPPSSPESMRTTSEAELALLGHQGLIKVSSANGNIPRGTKGSSRSSNVARLLHVTNQGLPLAIAQRNANMPTSQASTSKDFGLGPVRHA